MEPEIIYLKSFSLSREHPRDEPCIYLPCQINEMKYCSALLDSGAVSMMLIGEDLARNLAYAPRYPLDRKRLVVGFSGESSLVTQFMRLRLTIAGRHEEEVAAFIVPRLRKEVILGIPWLRRHNPQIDWNTSTLTLDSAHCLSSCLRPNRGHPLSVQGAKGISSAHRSTDHVTRGHQDNAAHGQHTRTPALDIKTLCVQEFQEELHDPANAVFEVNVSDIRSKNADDIAKALRPKPPPDFSKLPAHLQKYRALFCPEEAKSLPPYRPGVDHDIKLVDGATPPNSRMYGMSQNELLVLQKYIQENLDKGYIRPSTSPVASSVLFAKKPTGGLRLCVDYRKLNEVTVKDRTALPLTKESFARLSRAKYFTKVDVVSAFNRVRIKKGKEYLTAFRTRYGLYEYTVMPFGLCNAPATFIRLMNETLGFDLLDNAASPHMDDIIIFSETLEEHRRHVSQVFERCLAEGLYLDLDKCEFEVQKTKYLGFILEAGKGVSADPEKLSAIRDWQSPSSVKQVRSFLGFVNYYRRFIEGFSRIAKPLTDLTKDPHRRFEWTPTAEQAFQELKSRLVSAPILAHFDPAKPCVVVTDASKFASGAVLKQPTDDSLGLKDLRPVAFFSAKHSDTETRYDAHDKELLAIIKAFEEWRAELEGSAHQVQVWCDHRNLQYFRTARMLNDRQARWSDFLSRFDLVIKYFPGRQNVEADALSRRNQDDTHEPKEQLLLPPSLFSAEAKPTKRVTFALPDPEDGHTECDAQPISSMDPSARATQPGSSTRLGTPDSERTLGVTDDTPTELPTPDSELSPDLALKLREAYTNAPDSDPVKKIAQLLAEGARHSPYPLADCQTIHDRVYYQGRLWVPVDEDLRRQIIEENHCPPLVGHPGAAGTYSRTQQMFYWPKMHQDIRRFIRNCHPYQRSKPARKTPGQLLPLPVPIERWHDITMDFITDLPPAHRSTLCPGATSILVVVCRLSKEEHIIPCSKMTAEYLAAVFVRDVIRLHGIPRSIVTDRGTQFTSVLWKEICRLLGMKQSLTSAFHPQSDGQSERSNQEIKHHLRRLVTYSQEDWAD